MMLYQTELVLLLLLLLLDDDDDDDDDDIAVDSLIRFKGTQPSQRPHDFISNKEEEDDDEGDDDDPLSTAYPPLPL